MRQEQPLPLQGGIPRSAAESPALALGLRPFYLSGALAAAVVVPLWVAGFLGAIDFQPALPGPAWHAHEMIFGFAGAVIVGFLFTAGERWTSQRLPHGPTLGAFVAVWLLARITSISGPYALHVVTDIVLLPAAAAALACAVVASRNWRNAPIIIILLALGATNACHHLAQLGPLASLGTKPLHAALGLVVVLESVIGGRVIPAFISAAHPRAGIRSHALLDGATIASTVAALTAWVIAPDGPVLAALAAVAASLHLLRMVSWKPWVGFRNPMLWILGASYAFIPAGLACAAAASMLELGPSGTLHAFGAGATGGLILGMMCRSARGHTGRPIRASTVETAAFALVLAAALVRVAWPMLLPTHQAAGLVVAATLWCSAFLLFLARFTPWLLGPDAT